MRQDFAQSGRGRLQMRRPTALEFPPVATENSADRCPHRCCSGLAGRIQIGNQVFCRLAEDCAVVRNKLQISLTEHPDDTIYIQLDLGNSTIERWHTRSERKLGAGQSKL